jgi:NADH-quinone oxidoreductase subunit N
MYFGEASEPLDGRMPGLHWALLAVSSLAMILGVVNLFGVEGLAAAAAATLID